MHSLEVLFDAVLVLRPVIARPALVLRRQTAFQPLVPPERVLRLVRAAALGAVEHRRRAEYGLPEVEEL